MYYIILKNKTFQNLKKNSKYFHYFCSKTIPDICNNISFLFIKHSFPWYYTINGSTNETRAIEIYIFAVMYVVS